MKGWEIFVHSVRLVFSNLQSALQISLVPYAVSSLAYAYLGAEPLSLINAGDPMALQQIDGGLAAGLMVYAIVGVLASLWIVVAWHRFVLLEEYPKTWVPGFHGSPVLMYFLKGLMLGLIITGAVLLVMLTVGAVFLVAGLSLLLPFFAVAMGAYLFYRFCPILPAAALGKQMSTRDAWEATKGAGQDIAVLVLLVVLFSVLVQLPNTAGGADTFIGRTYSLVINWIMMLVGASVLTTFYGHYVEGRGID